MDRARPRRELSSGRKTTGADRVEHSRSYRIRIGRNSERGRESEELAICVQPAERFTGDPGPRTRASLPRLDLRDEELSILRYRFGRSRRIYASVFRARSYARWFRLVPGKLRCGGPGAGEGARGQAIRATVATIGDR